MLGVLIVSLRWNGAAAWYTPEAGSAFLRRHTSDGNSLGARFLLLTLSQLSPTQVLQPLPPDQVAELRGKSITLGAWVWATHPMRAYTPVLSDGIGNYFETIAISTKPAFYSFLAQVPENADQLMIALKAPATPKDGEIFYDGLVMVKGDYHGSEPGLFDHEGETIQWNGSPLTNLLRNPSFEKTWLKISPDINLHLLRWFRYEPSLVLTSLSDWKGSEWYYKVTFGNLFRTFWAKFGWGHIFLVGQKPYRVLMAVTLLSVLGVIAAFWRLKRAFSLELWVFMGIALTVVWGVAATRGIDSLFGNVFIPGSRYAYPVIVLTLLLLCAGWREVLQYFGKWLHLPSQVQYSIYLAIFIFLDGYSIYTIAQYYTRVP